MTESPSVSQRKRLLSESESSEASGNPDVLSSSTAEKPKRKQNRVEYEIVKNCGDAEFEDWWDLGEEVNWIRRNTYRFDGGYTYFFDCRYRERKGTACPMKLKITHENGAVEVKQSVGEHNYETTKDLLSPEVRKAVLKEVGLGRKPTQVRDLLKNKLKDTGADVPKLKQIQNLASRDKLKASSGLHEPFTDLELNQYCETHAPDVVEAMDDPIVLGHLLEKADEKFRFVVVWSTKNLVKKQSTSKLLQLDSTYSVMWSGFPVQIYGFSDANHTFHPTAVSASSAEDSWCYEHALKIISDHGYTPDAVLADGAASITLAVQTVYEGALRLMCSIHARRAVKRHLSGINSEIRQKLLADFDDLQRCQCKRQFAVGSELMLAYWKEKYNGLESVLKFAEYFQKEWVFGPLRMWFEGASHFTSHNNGLEGTNGVLKAKFDFRKLSFREFIEVVESAIHGYSSLVDYREVATVPKIPPAVYREACILKKLGAVQAESDCGQYNFTASSANRAFTVDEILENVERLNKIEQVEKWPDFVKLRYSVYTLELRDNWVRCSCPTGVKKHVCKHGVRNMGTRKLITYPEDAKAEPIEQRRAPKMGRPRKARIQQRF